MRIRLDSFFPVIQTMNVNTMRLIRLDHSGVLRDIDDRHINVDRLLFLRANGEQVKIVDVFSQADITRVILSQYETEIQ